MAVRLNAVRLNAVPPEIFRHLGTWFDLLVNIRGHEFSTEKNFI